MFMKKSKEEAKLSQNRQTQLFAVFHHHKHHAPI